MSWVYSSSKNLMLVILTLTMFFSLKFLLIFDSAIKIESFFLGTY